MAEGERRRDVWSFVRYCHITVVKAMEMMAEWWVGGRRSDRWGQGDEWEKWGRDREMGRKGEEDVWRSVSVLSEHYCMNWKTHTHARTLAQSSRMTVPLAIISSSINCITTDPPWSTHVCYSLHLCRSNTHVYIFEAWKKIRLAVQLISAHL